MFFDHARKGKITRTKWRKKTRKTLSFLLSFFPFPYFFTLSRPRPQVLSEQPRSAPLPAAQAQLQQAPRGRRRDRASLDQPRVRRGGEGRQAINQPRPRPHEQRGLAREKDAPPSDGREGPPPGEPGELGGERRRGAVAGGRCRRCGEGSGGGGSCVASVAVAAPRRRRRRRNGNRRRSQGQRRRRRRHKDQHIRRARPQLRPGQAPGSVPGLSWRPQRVPAPRQGHQVWDPEARRQELQGVVDGGKAPARR